MSDWYHETPNGLFGNWMTNRSKSLLASMPQSLTFMMSLSDPGVIQAWPRAYGRQLAIPGDAFKANVTVLAAGAAGAAVAAPAADSP